jgi:HD-GYP domain-containing protein (c-di-GMP phosphodiesterase class II)
LAPVHATIALRLAAVSLVLATLFGAIAYVVEAGRVEDVAVNLALRAASHYDDSARRMLGTSDRVELERWLRHFLAETPFIAVRMYDARKELAGEASGFETQESDNPIANAAASHVHDFPRPGARHAKRLTIGSEQIVQIVLPLIRGDGGVDGYFEGTYRLPVEAQLALHHRVRDAALAVPAITLLTGLALYPIILVWHRRAHRLADDLLRANLELLQVLGSAVALRDSDTDAHNYRVTLYAVALAEKMGLASPQIADLIAGALLHDVGKIGIADAILLKPGTLTEKEFVLMRQHVPLGLALLRKAPWLSGAMAIVAGHHERFDGQGYPGRMNGDAIPLSARLFAVADVFDALTSERPYKPPVSFSEAMDILALEAGAHLDPAAVAAFSEIAGPLYEQIGAADQERLCGLLRDKLDQYFWGTKPTLVAREIGIKASNRTLTIT